ncbi:hypothetical protein R1sor_003153 [Riccia sorocarpa]|uniref:Uncharacterized protein n=1 Tax=Riccia sorocarpa TaxID=122646 RepID=A0ABD3H2G1_9MARC
MGSSHFKLMQLLALLFSIISVSAKIGFDGKLIGSEAVTEKDDAHTLYGGAGFIKCTSDKLVEPVSTQDISELLQKLNAGGSRFKVRATRRGRHTPNRFVCAGKGGSAKSPTDAAVSNGMSVPVGVVPVYGNLTVGGVISASAHGSGAGVDSSLGDIVVGLKWVNGALAQVETWEVDDSNFAADVKHQLETSTPHILYFWRPDLGFYKAFHFKPLMTGDVPIHPYHPNGRSAMCLPSPQEFSMPMKVHMRDYILDFDDSSPKSDVLNAQGCALSASFMDIPVFHGGDKILQNATIPSSYAMIAEECTPYCSWDLSYVGATTEDTEFTIKLGDIDDWVKDVKSVIKAEEEERQKHLDRRWITSARSWNNWRCASTRPYHITVRILIARLRIPTATSGIIFLKRTLLSC